jgi:hypothetical protein
VLPLDPSLWRGAGCVAVGLRGTGAGAGSDDSTGTRRATRPLDRPLRLLPAFCDPPPLGDSAAAAAGQEEAEAVTHHRAALGPSVFVMGLAGGRGSMAAAGLNARLRVDMFVPGAGEHHHGQQQQQQQQGGGGLTGVAGRGKWLRCRPPPRPRYGCAAAVMVHDGMEYVVLVGGWRDLPDGGGRELLGDADVYDPRRDRWARAAPLQPPQEQEEEQEGGAQQSGAGDDTGGGGGGGERWRWRAQMDEPRWGSAAVVCCREGGGDGSGGGGGGGGDRLSVLGGCDATGQALASCEAFKLGRRLQLQPCFRSRWGGGSACGGPQRGSLGVGAAVYDAPLPDMLESRTGLGACMLGRRWVLALGGRRAGQPALQSVELLDLSAPTAAAACQAAAAAAAAQCGGGGGGQGGRHLRGGRAPGGWVRLPSMLSRRCLFGAVALYGESVTGAACVTAPAHYGSSSTTPWLTLPVDTSMAHVQGSGDTAEAEANHHQQQRRRRRRVPRNGFGADLATAAAAAAAVVVE